MFKSKEELINGLGMVALKKKFEYRVRRSFKTWFVTSCKFLECKFELRAVASPWGSYWRVLKFVKDHAYQFDICNQRPQQENTKLIATLIAPQLQQEGRIICPKEMQAYLKEKHGIEILYCKAFRAKQHAQNLIYRDPLQSF